MTETRKAIQKLVIAISNFEKIYTVNTPKIGRQSTELWLLYALNDGESHSQKQICEEWGFPRSTLNTVTKKCEADGYLTSCGPDFKRHISFRKSGNGKNT